jgi:3(or 17)beta-hydroxysteroid dehydrogenase
MERLADKICLITGTASGIGKAIAELFCQEGAFVLISDINDEKGCTLSNQLLNRSEYVHLDVSKEEEWIKVYDHIKAHYGRLDVLINNAGITGFTETKGPFNAENFDLESWHKVIAVNCDGVALGCKYAIRLMKEHRIGSIVNISSRSGLVGIPQAVAYAASKAASRNHTKSVALYCAEQGYNIRCNSIHPAAILTPMWDPMLGEGGDREKMIEQISSQIPLKRMGSALEVAYAALYLASDESSYVTGIELHVDGGILAGSSAPPSKKDLK